MRKELKKSEGTVRGFYTTIPYAGATILRIYWIVMRDFSYTPMAFLTVKSI